MAAEKKMGDEQKDNSKKNQGQQIPDAYMESLINLANMYKKIAQKTAETTDEVEFVFPYKDLPDVWASMISKFMEDPEKLIRQQMELYNDYLNIWNNAWKRYIGEESHPLYQPDPKDRRFQDPTWDNDLVFDFIKQSYVLTTRWLHQVIGELDGIDKKTLDKFDFYAQQFADAMSPSNFAFTNPEVIKETIETKGENLSKGFQNLLRDLENSKQFFQVKTTDKDAFKIGENIAATPGKVIFRNDLMELIQYNPSQKEAHKTPLLIVPAWINKYYILDLSPKNSFVKWAVDEGYTVFIISWVNPDKNLAHKKFENYMLEGPIAALDVIEKATGEKEITAMGYCLGGTLLSCTLSYMKSKNDTRIKAATFLTTMIDFNNVGEMSVFIDEDQIERLDKQMRDVGFLDGSEIASIFNALRANDLIWSFVVNNYLMGRETLPFDILYWNSDTTRLPADTHSFYLRTMYLKNLLKEPNAVTLAGVPVDVTKITTPSYILSTKEDHIAPWKTTYETTQLFKGPCKFVLAGSGHVAGVVNPPLKNKYCYWTNDKNPKSSSQWLTEAKIASGSWWDDWSNWNRSFSGEKISAPKPGSGKLKPIEDAPGSYIKSR